MNAAMSFSISHCELPASAAPIQVTRNDRVALDPPHHQLVATPVICLVGPLLLEQISILSDNVRLRYDQIRRNTLSKGLTL